MKKIKILRNPGDRLVHFVNTIILVIAGYKILGLWAPVCIINAYLIGAVLNYKFLFQNKKNGENNEKA